MASSASRLRIPAMLRAPGKAALTLFVLTAGATVGGMAVVLAGKGGLSPLLAMSVALPVALAGLFLLVTRVDWLLAGVLLTRASLEPLFLALKGDSEGMGPGAAINALVIVLGALFFLRKPRAFARPHLLVWLVFLALAVSGTRYAPDSGKATRMLLVYLTYFVMFALPLVLVESTRQTRHWLIIVLVASIVPTLFGLADMATGGISAVDLQPEGADDVFGIPEYEGFRIQGAFNHPNIYAFFLVTLVTALLYAIRLGVFDRDRRLKMLAWGYLGLQAILLLATQTRGAWAGLALVMIAYGVAFDRRVLVGMALACVALLFVPVVQDRVLELFVGKALKPTDTLNSYEWRLAMWSSAWPWIQDHWLLGWGLDSYTEYSRVFFPLEHLVAFDAHNVYVQLAFELGFPGVSAFVLVFVAMLAVAVSAWRRRRTESVMLAVLVLTYLMACYSDNMHRYLVSNWYTFFVMGLLCATATLPAGEARR